MKADINIDGVDVFGAVCVVASFGALISIGVFWVAHVIACIKASAWVLMIIGIFVPPIGWVHGMAWLFGWL